MGKGLEKKILKDAGIKNRDMAKSKKIIMTVAKTTTGFSAYSVDYPIFSTAQSIPELINNTYEATGLYFEEEEINIRPSNIDFEIDFKQFF